MFENYKEQPPRVDEVDPELGPIRGNYFTGFLWGLIFGPVSVLVLHFVGASDTRRGSRHGFGVNIAIYVVAIIVSELL